jgi:D-alanyl-lipoteichoic acid acyltransferase DltB (MBOAT superfamily)
MIISILITYFCGLVLGRLKESSHKYKKHLLRLTLLISLALNLAILFYFKYFKLLAVTVNSIFSGEFLPVLNIILPVGISFYTFQALGYTFDVYKGDIKCERNIVIYAAFVSFFPQLVAGPIERAGNLLAQFKSSRPFNYDEAHKGLVQIGWGLFCKMVIADRIAMFVNPVFEDHGNQPGYMLAVAAVLFSLQIYCDFSSYSNIAIGSAQLLGFKLMKNFNSPFLALSVSDFWARWHISLTTWFRDYVYIPLGGNRKGKARRLLNIFVIFLLSGLWHGAEWSFVLWGVINGLYLMLSDLSAPLRKKIVNRFKINRENWFFKTVCRVQTFILISFAFIFFRAKNILDAFAIIKRIFTNFELNKLDTGNFFGAGLDAKDFMVAIIAIIIMLIIDFLSQKMVVKNTLITKPLAVRWAIYICLIMSITVLGIYGPQYDPSPFIYFQF